MPGESEPVTFEEARRRFTGEREEEGEEPFYSEESDVVPDEEDLEERLKELESIIRSTPDRLSGFNLPSDRDASRQRNGLIDIAVDLPGLTEGLENAESQLDFLENIAQSNLSVLETELVLADTMIEMLESVFQVERFLSPLSAITVSGTNVIEDADTAELVVPDSDSTEIPTRVLMMKTSENNQEPIAIGDDETEPTVGWVLHPNENLVINWNLIGGRLYMASSQAGQTIELLGMV